MAGSQTIAIIVLAAGESHRFGAPKQLARLRGVSLVRHAVQVALSAATINPPEPSGAPVDTMRRGLTSAADVLVILGPHAGAVRDQLRDLPVEFVDNPRYCEGIGTSIRAGVDSAARRAYDALIVMPCDQPRLTPQILRDLMEKRIKHRVPVAACDYGSGVIGPPTLFGYESFSNLLAIPAHSGAKGVIEMHRDNVALVPFPGGAMDVDTPEDLPPS